MIRLRSVELKYSPSEIEMDGDPVFYRSRLFNIGPLSCRSVPDYSWHGSTDVALASIRLGVSFFDSVH